MKLSAVDHQLIVEPNPHATANMPRLNEFHSPKACPREPADAFRWYPRAHGLLYKPPDPRSAPLSHLPPFRRIPNLDLRGSSQIDAAIS